MLKEYKAKRNFSNTPEPAGRKQAAKKHLRFVVQRHDATRLHYDFRLELDGVLKSWAVPKGPSMNPSDKRLAVHVEDHPVDYISFHGVIPEGNYGAGPVEIWDKGNYIPVNAEIEPISQREALKWLKGGELKFVIMGTKLSGEFVLVRLKQDEKNWLLIKHKDEYAVRRKYDAEKEAPLTGKVPAKKKTVTTSRSAANKTASAAAAKSGTAKGSKKAIPPKKGPTVQHATAAPRKKASKKAYAGKKAR